MDGRRRELPVPPADRQQESEGVIMEKYRILCFGDSLTWGYDPVKRTRIGEDERWTGVLQNLLGERYKVIEEGQNGRTIASEDPTEGEKNGLAYIIPCLDSQRPLDLMILMLGTNDMKRKFGYTARDIAGEMQLFLEKVQAFNRFRMEGRMQVLLMSPPITGARGRGKGSWLEDYFDYDRAFGVASELAAWYEQLAKTYHCHFLDAAGIVQVSEADGVHLDPKEQTKLGGAIYEKLLKERLVAAGDAQENEKKR